MNLTASSCLFDTLVRVWRFNFGARSGRKVSRADMNNRRSRWNKLPQEEQAEDASPSLLTPDIADEGTASSPASSTGADDLATLRRVMPDVYFVNTPVSRSLRHLDLLRHLASVQGDANAPEKTPPLLDFHVTGGQPLTETTFCAWDQGEPGLLSQLCGTMAALNLSVHTAFIYTLRDADGALGLQSDRDVALDTFLLSENYFGHDRAMTAKTHKKLKAELSRVLRGEVSVSQLLAKSRRPFAPIVIHDLSVENLAQDAATRISLRAKDSPGLLFRVTSALAKMELQVRVAMISTRDESADDLFFVTDKHGQRLPDFQLSTLSAHLRALLQDTPLPATSALEN